MDWQGMWSCLGAQAYNQNLASSSAPPAVVVGSDGLADAYAITGFVPGTSLYAVAHIWRTGGQDWAWTAMNSGCF